VERQGSQPLHQDRLLSLPSHLPAHARSVVGVGRDASCSARASAPPQLLLPSRLSAPVPVESTGLPIHPRHVPSASALQPAAGAGVAVAAQFAAARAAVPGIKPWQASAVLLRRSLSSPLLGVAEELGQQQPLSLGNQGDDSAAEAAGGGFAGGCTRGEMWTQEALSESRMRLVAGGTLQQLPCQRWLCFHILTKSAGKNARSPSSESAGKGQNKDMACAMHLSVSCARLQSTHPCDLCFQPTPIWSVLLPAASLPPFNAGLKRYFHAKRGEGLLSAQGLRILDYACDRAMDQAHAPLVRAQCRGLYHNCRHS
jgi:hypothetical protein